MSETGEKPIPRKLLRCKRCGYRWFSTRKDKSLPKICPGCKSPYWNEDKVKHFQKTAVYRGDTKPRAKPDVTSMNVTPSECKPALSIVPPPPQVKPLSAPLVIHSRYTITEEEYNP